MPSPPVLTVVLPAYREEQNLRELLPRLNAALAGLGAAAEIVVVDTMAPEDATAEVCGAHGARHCRRRGGNRYGNAVRTGIAAANGEYILFMDADGSHPPELVVRLFELAATHDVVAASRYVEGGATENPAVLILMSWMVNFGFRLILGLRCQDISNSYKLYRTADLKSLQLRSDDFDIIEEMLFKLHRNRPGLKIAEVPFTFRQRRHGTTKRNLPLFVVTYLYTLVRLRFFVR